MTPRHSLLALPLLWISACSSGSSSGTVNPNPQPQPNPTTFRQQLALADFTNLVTSTQQSPGPGSMGIEGEFLVLRATATPSPVDFGATKSTARYTPSLDLVPGTYRIELRYAFSTQSNTALTAEIAINNRTSKRLTANSTGIGDAVSADVALDTFEFTFGIGDRFQLDLTAVGGNNAGLAQQSTLFVQDVVVELVEASEQPERTRLFLDEFDASLQSTQMNPGFGSISITAGILAIRAQATADQNDPGATRTNADFTPMLELPAGSYRLSMFYAFSIQANAEQSAAIVINGDEQPLPANSDRLGDDVVNDLAPFTIDFEITDGDPFLFQLSVVGGNDQGLAIQAGLFAAEIFLEQL